MEGSGVCFIHADVYMHNTLQGESHFRPVWEPCRSPRFGLLALIIRKCPSTLWHIVPWSLVLPFFLYSSSLRSLLPLSFLLPLPHPLLPSHPFFPSPSLSSMCVYVHMFVWDCMCSMHMLMMFFLRSLGF